MEEILMEKWEREISLQELIWKIILGWRFLLVSAVIFTVLLTAVGYLKNLTSYQEEQNPSSQTKVPQDYKFTEEDLHQIRTAELLKNSISKSREYLEDSILMNLDPYEEQVLILQYYVDSDYQFNYTKDNRTDYSSAVTTAYSEYMQNGELAQKIKKSLKLDLKAKYLNELIFIDVSKTDGIFCIEVLYPDKNVLSEIAEVIKEELNNQTAGISEKVGSHSLTLFSDNITIKTDMDLANRQKASRDMLNAYDAQLNSLKASMSTEQLEQLKLSDLDEDQTPEDMTQVEPLGMSVILLKYMIFGFAVGLFLAAIWLVCQMLFNGKLQTSDELVDIYSLRLFGTLQNQGKVSGLDKVLVGIKNRHKKQLSSEESLDILVSNIELTCKNKKISQIYLTGTEIEKADSELIQQIIDRLKHAEIEVIYGENICYHSASLRKLVEVGTAVIVEEVQISIYKEIAKEIMIIREQKVDIIGCIGINSKV